MGISLTPIQSLITAERGKVAGPEGEGKPGLEVECSSLSMKKLSKRMLSNRLRILLSRMMILQEEDVIVEVEDIYFVMR
uniref:Uncharacterized protein n=1 Tax=Pristionchus pacificus TaxID=54126 RepID=A0A2A6C2E4_PRIPA|eukprot:PDM72402.1 hypothetical protein PRIPAC_38836 [Pristionchus pacificus]